MRALPKLLVSSVVRGAMQGDSHGGLYIVDPEGARVDQVVDWNDCGIDFEGRGADRGLRGIIITEGLVFVAASDELFVFDQRFNIVESYRNAYLKHCHEMWEHQGALYLTSTGFDSVLRFDLAARRFDLGLQLLRHAGALSARIFNPLLPGGPPAGVEFHINNVYVDQSGVFVAGRHLAALMRITPQSVLVHAELPLGAHNARPFGDGVIYNDTEADALVWRAGGRVVSIPVPRYPEADLLRADADDSGLARQAFARGLCPLSGHIVACGSSPTTVSICDLAAERRTASINLTMDVRNAAHGMAAWPF